MRSLLALIMMLTASVLLNAQTQESRVRIAFFDGVIVGGYVDQGAYLNCTGPNINLTAKNSKFILGMLPSLRFKEDHGTTKNALVTPNLGFGFTYCYKSIAIQVPLYYNAKTATANGKWNIGIGLGWRINGLNKPGK